MSFDEEHILQNYIARLLTMQDEREEWLESGDLESAALELGLSSTDLQKVSAVAVAHRQRGQNFAQHKAWDDAIGEYEQAVVLNPLDTSLLHELATAHKERWWATGQEPDKAAAERYSRRCIQLDPNFKASYELLRELERTPIRATESGRPTRKGVLIALVLVVAFVLLLTFLRLSAEPSQPSAPPPPPPVENPSPVASQLASTPSSGTMPDEMELPVRMADTGDHSGLQLNVQQSQFRNFGESFSYTVNAGLLVGQNELHRLRLRVDLVNSEGDILYSENADVVSDHQPSLRPGDTAPANKLIFKKEAPPLIDHALLTVDVVEWRPSATSYGSEPIVPIEWDIPEIPYVQFEVRERKSRVSEGLSEYLHFLTLAITNKGTRSIEHLRFEVTRYDTEGNAFSSDNTYVVSSSGPVLRSSEVRVVRSIGSFAEDEGPLARYVVTVIEAE